MESNKNNNSNSSPENLAIATLGGGCFWCVEAVFERVTGVHEVVSGYAGGKAETANYKAVCSGTTQHAEVVQIHYDPNVISYEEILEIFWTTHDPTTLNRQGNDRGTQYRSAVFYANDAERDIAERSKAEVAAPLYDDPIVTEISPLETFYEAEKYHQGYYDKTGDRNPYCTFVITPKVNKLRKKFANRLKETA